MILLLIQLYKHIKTHEEKHAQTHKAVISNSKLPYLLLLGSPDHHDHKHHNRHHNDQRDDHNRVWPQSNAGQVHPSHRGEVGHTEPQLEREIQIVSDFCENILLKHLFVMTAVILIVDHPDIFSDIEEPELDCLHLDIW